MPDFTFTRLQYTSGNWDVDQRMPANLLDSLIQYTTLEVDPEEKVVPLRDPAMLQAPFCYISGHRLVQFDRDERDHFERYVRNGGFVFADDCNHDIDGSSPARSKRRWPTFSARTHCTRLPATTPSIMRSSTSTTARRRRLRAQRLG